VETYGIVRRVVLHAVRNENAVFQDGKFPIVRAGTVQS
jgi:hypothetical protein